MSNVQPSQTLHRNCSVKATYPPQSRVILFGNENDHEIQESRKRIEAAGRAVIIQRRAGFDTGIGACGTHLCHCKGYCKNTGAPI